MKVINLSSVISASSVDSDGGVDKSDWLNIVQDEIDPRFEMATSDFISTVAATTFSGGDPYSLLTFDCPVTRTITSDGVVASYEAIVIVNRSQSLEGRYTLSARKYSVSGPRKETRTKSGSILTEKRKSIELGWLPLQIAVTQEYPADPHLSWKQENGYLYLDQAAYAALFVQGIADVDVWSVFVEHLQGDSFPDSSIIVTAKWGDGNEVDAEIKIPGCVLDTFRECQSHSVGIGGIDPQQKKWTDWRLNPCLPKECFYDGCTGKKIRCDKIDDKR